MCIGEQIRNQRGPLPEGCRATYGKEELRLLQMTERIAVGGSKRARQTLAVLLEALTGFDAAAER